MTRKVQVTMVAFFGLLMFAVPALAHHAASAEFDVNTPVTVKGTITKVEWINPHCYIYVDSTDASGKVSQWSFETTNPRLLHTAGITREDFGIGQVISMTGILAKDHTKNFAWMRKATFQDGHTVEVWPANTDYKDER